MKHQCFYKQQLLLVENEGKVMLYRFPLYGKAMSKLSDLTPVDFIPAPQKHIFVDEDADILITDEDVFTLKGEKLLHAPNLTDIKIMRKSEITVVLATNSAEKCKEILIFLGTTAVLHEKGREISVSEFYFALLQNDQWVIYDWCGNEKNRNYPVQKDELCIQGRFLIKTGMAKHELYSLKEGEVLKTNQNVVLCSATHDFAICAALGGNLQIYSNGKWYDFGKNATFFDILDDISVFCVQQNGKYYVYGYDMSCWPFFASNQISDGVDFFSYDAQSQTIVWVNDEIIHVHTLPRKVCL